MFLLLPIFLLASVSHKISEKEQIPQNDSSTKIFMSEGTVMVGSENMYQAEVIQVNNVEDIKNSSIAKLSLPQEENKAISQKELQRNKNKIAYKPLTKTKVEYNFSSIPLGTSDINQKLQHSIIAIISPNNTVQKSSGTESSFNKIVAITSQLKKQKYYSSLTYSQFCKYSNSSLRGPPSV